MFGGKIDPRRVVEIATSLIKIPSPTEGEQEVVEWVRAFFDESGFEDIDVHEVAPGRPQVVARVRGTKPGRCLMLNGHLDNDSLTAAWEEDPYTPVVDGNRLWGAGIHNMKSGVAAMLAAAEVVRRHSDEFAGSLLVACVVGELQGGKGTIKLLERGYTADAAVVPEPYSLRHLITKCVGVHKCAFTAVPSDQAVALEFPTDHAVRAMLGFIPQLDELPLNWSDVDFPGVPRLLVASVVGESSPPSSSTDHNTTSILINTIGRSVHTSRSETGVDAIRSMMRAIESLDRHMDIDGASDRMPRRPLVVSRIAGGRSRELDLAGPSNVSDFCSAVIDFYEPNGASGESACRRARNILEHIASNDDSFTYECELSTRRIPQSEPGSALQLPESAAERTVCDVVSSVRPKDRNGYCAIIVDLRYPQGPTPDDIDAHLRQCAVNWADDQSHVKIRYSHPPDQRFRVGGADMPPTNVSKDAEIVAAVAAVHNDVVGYDIEGIGAVVPYSYCGNDTAHLERAGIPCVLYGPRGYPEAVERHVRIDEMVDCARVLVDLAFRYCSASKS